MSTPAAVHARLLTLGDGRPQVEVLESGSGTPLLFLHGAGGIPSWDGILPLLAQRYRVCAPLLPGFGKSTGHELLVDQLDLFLHGFDVLDALALDRPYVVGESVGGWLAAEMAALRPKEIGRLALLAPLGVWRDEAPVVDMFGLLTNELVPFLFHDTQCAAAQEMMGTAGLLSTTDDRSAEQVETLISMGRGARTVAQFLYPIPDTGLERRLGRIRAPTLILWGADDRFIAPSYADIFQSRIDGARQQRIPAAGHLLALERPDDCAAAILRWGKGQS